MMDESNTDHQKEEVEIEFINENEIDNIDWRPAKIGYIQQPGYGGCLMIRGKGLIIQDGIGGHVAQIMSSSEPVPDWPHCMMMILGEIYAEDFIELSDRINKQSITPFKDDFSKILSVEPKTYTRRGSSNLSTISYFAEDFHKLGLKQLIHYDEDG